MESSQSKNSIWNYEKHLNNGLKAVDLFCGAGIGAMGVKQTGVEIIWAIDNDQYAVDTYNKNVGNHAVCKSIRNVTPEEVPDHDIMIATPVCKSFSVAGSQKGFDDEKNGDLTYHFTRLLRDKMPKAFLFENVGGMVNKRNIEDFKKVVKKISDYGYKVEWQLINCWEHGVPQERKRVFMVGVRNDIDNDFSFPERVGVSNRKDIKYAIWDLKNNKSISNHSETLELGYSPRYLTRNRQRQWDEPAFTIVSEARHLPLYPEPPNYDIRFENIDENPPPRRFTVRENLRLQTVPDSFSFSDDIPLKKQYERCSGIPSLMAYKLVLGIVDVLDLSRNKRAAA